MEKKNCDLILLIFLIYSGNLPFFFLHAAAQNMLSKAAVILAIFSGANALDAYGDAVVNSNSTSHAKYAFEAFKAEFRREYESKGEENKRFKVFQKNLLLIEERNAAERNAGGSAMHGITRFADVTQEEFKARYLKTVLPKNLEKKNLVSLKPPASGSSADWTGTYTTPVKDQVNSVYVI